jgi:hypothetical protein
MIHILVAGGGGRAQEKEREQHALFGYLLLLSKPVSHFKSKKKQAKIYPKI